jgi:hypothetical protein
VEFLTDEQAAAYGKFAEEPTRPELERFSFLDDVDRDLIALRRTKHHQQAPELAEDLWPVAIVGRVQRLARILDRALEDFFAEHTTSR